MALFKIHKGRSENLPQTYHEGYAYFTIDDGKFYIDITDEASGRLLLNPDSITNLSASGKTITYTKNDGSTGTITTQDTNTDKNVTQTVTTADAAYPLLLAPNGQTATKTTTSYFDSGVTLNPSTNTIAANISGNADSATKLATPRTISLTGDVTGSASFDGSANASITATVADNSHNHNASNITAGTLAAARLPVATTSIQGAMSAADKTKLNVTNIAYGTCSTAAATAEKAITLTENTNWTLSAGSIIIVKFSNTNTAQNPTFNVNGTGAKSVWFNTYILTTSSLGYAGTKNRPMIYVYDGTQYVFLGWSYDTNTTYSNASLGQGYATCTTAAATVAKVATLSSYALTTGGIVAVKFSYDVPANATLNINSKGAKAIYYKGVAITDGVINAGDVATFIYNGTQYHLIAIDSSVATLTSDPRESDNETPELSAVPVNADSLGGILASEYATKEWVLNNIRFASEVSW